MSIIRIEKRDPGFAQIDNRVLSDNRLTWKAKGVLCYLLGKPGNWKVQVVDLINSGSDGEYAIRAALNELIEVGYATRTAVRREGGVFDSWDYTIHETPLRGFPDVDNPLVGKPDVDNRALNNTELTNTDSNNTESARDEPQTPKQTEPPQPEPDEPIIRWFESIGVMPTATDMPAVKKMQEQGATVSDLQDALAWWKDNGRTIHSVRQMSSSVETAIRKRKQAEAPAARRGKSGAAGNASGYQGLTVEQAAAKYAIEKAARKAAREQWKIDNGYGTAAGANSANGLAG